MDIIISPLYILHLFSGDRIQRCNPSQHFVFSMLPTAACDGRIVCTLLCNPRLALRIKLWILLLPTHIVVHLLLSLVWPTLPTKLRRLWFDLFAGLDNICYRMDKHLMDVDGDFVPVGRNYTSYEDACQLEAYYVCKPDWFMFCIGETVDLSRGDDTSSGIIVSVKDRLTYIARDFHTDKERLLSLFSISTITRQILLAYPFGSFRVWR